MTRQAAVDLPHGASTTSTVRERKARYGKCGRRDLTPLRSRDRFLALVWRIPWNWLDEPPGAGRCAIFIFDYTKLSDTYGAEVFASIEEALEATRGVCAFMDGDLEVAAGGLSGVPGLLLEIRDAGWVLGTHQPDGPLVQLVTLDHLHAYATAMWTDSQSNTTALDSRFTARFPEAYLGFLQQPRSLDLPTFHELLKPLQLPVRGTYVDGCAAGT